MVRERITCWSFEEKILTFYIIFWKERQTSTDYSKTFCSPSFYSFLKICSSEQVPAHLTFTFLYFYFHIFAGEQVSSHLIWNASANVKCRLTSSRTRISQRRLESIKASSSFTGSPTSQWTHSSQDVTRCIHAYLNTDYQVTNIL